MNHELDAHSELATMSSERWLYVPVHAPSMLHSVYEYDLFGLEDFVDGSIVAPQSRVPSLEFSD